MQKNINFISGHLSLTQDEFNKYYKSKIDLALEKNESFVVGDTRGADTLAQNYLLGKSKNVIVYHMFETPRNNVDFKTKGGFKSDKERDRAMTKASTTDIAWVREGREKSGTQNNINRRKNIAEKLKLN